MNKGSNKGNAKVETGKGQADNRKAAPKDSDSVKRRNDVKDQIRKS